jgi:Tfp pilus assembly protein PilF
MSLYYINRAQVYFQQEKYIEALADSSTAIKFDNKNAEAYSLRGEIYVNLDHASKALANFEEAVSLNPNDIVSYASYALLKKVSGENKVG